MARLNLTLGTVILIGGFLIYQLGFSIVLHQAGIPSPLATIFPEGSDLAFIGTVLEFAGGILGIIGFIICISSAISTQRKETLREIAKLGAFRAPPRYEEPITPARKCKFCGTEMDELAVFCPVCNRSQK